jgi:CheY-like chemotaxis protein
VPSLLALEPDFDRAALLRVVVDEHVRVPLTIVDSIEGAFAAIDRGAPDIILLSALTPASDEAQLVERLRALPKSAYVQTLITPDLTPPADPPAKRYGYARRLPTREACDPVQFAEHVNAYLAVARERRLDGPMHMFRDGAERRAAMRHDCPHRPEVTINGTAVSVIDLSSTGAQIVSPSLLVPGRLVDVAVGVDDRTYHCRASVVWGLFENGDSSGTVSYRAGVDFKSGDAMPDALIRAPEPVVVPSTEQALVRRPTALERSRADRITASELPRLSAVRLPWGAEATLLNLSRTGVLFETFSKLTPGSSAAIKLCAQDSTVVVPARFVRSEVVTVDGRGVRYRAAAMFESAINLDEFGISLPRESTTPNDLAEWLRKLANEIHRNQDAARLQKVLEAGAALAAAVAQ